MADMSSLYGYVTGHVSAQKL